MKREVPKRWVQRGALNKSQDGKMSRSQPRAVVLEGTIYRKRDRKAIHLEERKKEKGLND